MADIRINALATTATTPASDDYLALDGTAQGTRKILATNIANNVTDVILGASGPSVKSSLSARAPRQGLVFDGSGNAATMTVGAFGATGWSIAATFQVNAIGSSQAIIAGSTAPTPVIYVSSAGKIVLSNAFTDKVTGSTTLVANKNYHLVVVGNGTTSTIYLNGISDASDNDTTNYSNGLTQAGNFASALPFAGEISIIGAYNRALSASEVVSLYEAGAPSGADYPTQVAGTQLITGTDSDFSGAGNWVANAATVTVSGGKLNVTNCTANNYGTKILKTFQKDVKYRLIVAVSGLTGGTSVAALDSTGTTFATLVAGTNVVEFTAPATGSGYLFIVRKDTDPVTAFSLDDVFMFPLGLLLAPDAAQAGGGLTWYDTSGNAANITLPASGVSWNVPTSGKMATSLTVNGGALTVNNLGASSAVINATQSASTGYSYLELKNTGGTAQTWQLGLGGSGIGGLAQQIYAYDQTANAVRFSVSTSGNFLLKGDGTDSANGKLQLATHTNSAGGIGFGTDTSLYRTAAGALRLNAASGNTYFELATGGTRIGTIATNGAVLWYDSATDHIFRTGATFGGTTALTLDSSQNAEFKGNIKTAAPSGGTAATWRLGTVASVSPTSPNRTIEVEIGGTTYYIHAKTTND